MNNVIIAPDGTIIFIYSDDLVELLDIGQSDVRRASHVEPVSGGWTADMSPVGGPVLLDNGSPFKLRTDALAAEVAWLDTNLLGIGGQNV